MTENVWLGCTEQRKLLDFVRDKASKRKFALFVIDTALRNWGILNDDAHTLYLTIEGFIEGKVTKKRLDKVYRDYTDGTMSGAPEWDDLAGWDSGTFVQLARNHKVEAKAQLAAIRDIFGNPFRPAVCEPRWRTSDVTLLASGIYKERAFDRMPILADALQDAGCDNDDVLNHCRDVSVRHVRGCWVLDLVLGK